MTELGRTDSYPLENPPSSRNGPRGRGVRTIAVGLCDNDQLFGESNRVVVSRSTPCPTEMVVSSSSGKPTSELLLTLARTLPVLSLHRKRFRQDRNPVLCTPIRNASCRRVECFLFAPQDAQEDRQHRLDTLSLAVCRR